MEFTEVFSKLNWWAILLATISSLIVGFLWYDKRAFGKQWIKLVGLSEKQIKSSKGRGRALAWTAIVSFLSAATLGYLMTVFNCSGFLNGLLFGTSIGAIFRLGNHIIHNGFSQQPAALTAINGGHDIVVLAVAGALMGVIA